MLPHTEVMVIGKIHVHVIAPCVWATMVEMALMQVMDPVTIVEYLCDS